MTLADLAWRNVVSMERSSFWVTVRLTCDFLSGAKTGEWIEAVVCELMSDKSDDIGMIVRGLCMVHRPPADQRHGRVQGHAKPL